LEAGYPNPTADAYLCTAVRPVPSAPDWLRGFRLQAIGVASDGGTLMVSWADVLAARQVSGDGDVSLIERS
jgi:hypothetical protein